MEGLWHMSSRIFSQKYSLISSGVCLGALLLASWDHPNFLRCLFLSSPSSPLSPRPVSDLLTRLSWAGHHFSPCALCSLYISAYSVVPCNTSCPRSWCKTPSPPLGSGSMHLILKGLTCHSSHGTVLSLSYPVHWDTLLSQTWAQFTMANLVITTFPRQWRVP